MMKAPVLIIAYQRFDFLSNILNSGLIDRRKIYIHIDGPASDSVILEVMETIRIVENFSQTNENVKILIQEQNLGVKRGPIAAIDWIFSHEETAIIIEEDIVITNAFLEFCDWGLDAFAAKTDIWQINGWTPIDLLDRQGFPYLCIYSHIWGWATWRNRWWIHDRNLEWWSPGLLENNPLLQGWAAVPQFAHYWNARVEEVLAGSQTWDVAWFISGLILGCSAVSPAERLTGNIGFDDRASHTAGINSPSYTLLPSKTVSFSPMLSSSLIDYEATLLHNQRAFHIMNSPILDRIHHNRHPFHLISTVIRRILPKQVKRFLRFILSRLDKNEK
jgi:hypothetical protein